jgi:glyoxylase-like metal-dependent hydrolase (beta-lactamase superfamily II)/Flp pilus assembly protein TadD
MKKKSTGSSRIIGSFLVVFFFIGVYSGSCSLVFGEEGWSKHLAKFKATVRSFEKGTNYFKSGDYKKAEKVFKKCVDKFPQHAYAHYYLARVFYGKQDFRGALVHIRKAKESLDFMLELTTIALKKKYGKMETQKRAVDNMVGEGILTCADRERMYDHKANVQEKIDHINRALDRSDSGDNALKSGYAFFYGNVLFKMQQYKSAAREYGEAIKLNPENWEAYNNLAGLHFLFKDYMKSLGYIKLAEARGAGMHLNLELKKHLYEALGKSSGGILEQEYPGGVMRFTVNILAGKNKPGRFYENTYVVFDEKTKDAVIVDPGARDERIETFIKARGLKVRKILNTHDHDDHTDANRYYADLYGAEILCHEADGVYFRFAEKKKNKPHRFLKGGESIEVNGSGFVIRVIHTPGHTAGGCCFLVNGLNPVLLSGDTLFREKIGRPEGKTAAERQKTRELLISSIKAKLLILPGDTVVFPGHGLATTIGAEKEHNPFLK